MGRLRKLWIKAKVEDAGTCRLQLQCVCVGPAPEPMEVAVEEVCNAKSDRAKRGYADHRTLEEQHGFNSLHEDLCALRLWMRPLL